MSRGQQKGCSEFCIAQQIPTAHCQWCNNDSDVRQPLEKWERKCSITAARCKFDRAQLAMLNSLSISVKISERR